MYRQAASAKPVIRSSFEGAPMTCQFQPQPPPPTVHSILNIIYFPPSHPSADSHPLLFAILAARSLNQSNQ